MTTKRKPIRTKATRCLDWRWGRYWWYYKRGEWRDFYNTSWIVPCDMRGQHANSQ